MNKHFKKIMITLFLCQVTTEPSLHADTSANSKPISVHDMFKDVPQDELLAMMEEGQQFIKYLETHGTAQEKMDFARAMEETLQNFSEDDWKEFEAIVETVQDKLPPFTLDDKEDTLPEMQEESQPSKESIKVIENSFEKILKSISKTFHALLMKAKSDKVLAERITMTWSNKDEFNELIRLLQCLQKKELVDKLSSSKDEADKTLVELITNFNKRLQMENDELIIADTFGLKADELTTTTNLKKLNEILQFFDKALESLFPKLVNFFNQYEPEALKISQDLDKQAKKSLDNAIKIEKQKRPTGYTPSSDKSPSYGSSNKNNHAHHHNSQSGNGANASQHEAEYLEQMHKEHLKNIPNYNKSSSDNKAGAEKESQKKQEPVKKTEYEKITNLLESYLETNDNSEIAKYTDAINKSYGIYKEFGTPIDEKDKIRAQQLTKKRSANNPLKDDEELFLQKHAENLQDAHAKFVNRTQTSHTHYDSIKESVESVALQIGEMEQIINSIKNSLEMMNSKELEKLNSSSALKTFSNRINQCHDLWKNAQRELKNKHRMHKLERENAYEMAAYNELESKVNSLHGFDSKITQTKSRLESLHKSIKTAIARHKRDENKSSHNK